MDAIKLSLVASLVSIIPGQTLRLNLLDSAAITIADVFVSLTILFFLIYSLLITKNVKIPGKIFFPAALFTLAALASLFLSLVNFSIAQIATSALFLFRFFSYFLLTIVFYNIIKRRQILNWVHAFLLIGSIFIIIGFIQFVTFSDLSFLTPYGWDPHRKRIVSSFLDPNFAGFVITTVAAFSTSLFLYKKSLIYLFVSCISFLATILTFSRSSYLAAIFIILTIGILKSSKLIATAFIVFLITFLIIPQMRIRIIGALTLDETAQARLTSWQNALAIFETSPVFGIGFNTYRYAQAEFGFFPPGELGGHSGSGTDSSLLLVLATTGIFGTFFFLLLLISIFNCLRKKADSSYLHLASIASFIGLLIHSQFVNSLFFPQIMLILWFILGLNLVDDI
ncbi:O-antigen ligase family protein [Candidatus Curtissbacteria bacterium]|nr:O-antigen ligase family protein [Candidatus Curtissbacteria bacterium]